MHPAGFPTLTGNPQNAPRCGAHSRRTGEPCRAPAIRGKQRCRMHGGKGSGAPLRNQNAVTWGSYTAKARGQHLWMTLLLYWITGDRRRLRCRISNPMEVEALAGCLRSFGYQELAADLLNEIGTD